jgi:hypothetical protein
VLFVALTQNPIIGTLFQREVDLIRDFNISAFRFRLIDFRQCYDVFRYIVSCRDFCMPILLLGIDVTRYSSPISNVDFLDFVWNNYRRFNFKKKHAILTLPNSHAPIPRMLCMQYYRTRSDGWRGIGNCAECVDENEFALLPLTDCTLRLDCQCNICVQPPSLAHLAIHVLTNFTMSLRLFTFKAETTYDQYVYACRSQQVPSSARLPPEYPVRLWFQCRHDSPYRYHRDCPGWGDGILSRDISMNL